MENFEEASLEEVNQLLIIQQPAGAGQVVQPQQEVGEMTPDSVHDAEVASLNLSVGDHDQSAENPAIVSDIGTKVEEKDLTLESVLNLKIEPGAEKPKLLSELDTVSLSDCDDSLDDVKHKKIISNAEGDTTGDNNTSEYLLERIRELKEERDKVILLLKIILNFFRF